MADWTFTIPDEAEGRVVDALCERGHWIVEDGDRAAFAKGAVTDYIRSVTRNYEGKQAAQAAERAARQKAEAEIVITEQEVMRERAAS